MRTDGDGGWTRRRWRRTRTAMESKCATARESRANRCRSSLLGALAEQVRWADVVHLHAAYSFPTIPKLLAARMLKRPVVWTPHGALQRWSGSRRVRLQVIVGEGLHRGRAARVGVAPDLGETRSRKLARDFRARISNDSERCRDSADAQSRTARRTAAGSDLSDGSIRRRELKICSPPAAS